jgi:hypothetical protein
MPDHCILIIESKNNLDLPNKIFINKSLFKKIEKTDNRSGTPITDDNNTLNNRMNYQKTLQWILSSQNFVEGFNIQSHISWILEKINPNHSLLELQKMGFEYIFKFHWESNGTGAGPIVTYKTAELLLQHGINLQLQFHLQHYDTK